MKNKISFAIAAALMALVAMSACSCASSDYGKVGSKFIKAVFTTEQSVRKTAFDLLYAKDEKGEEIKKSDDEIKWANENYDNFANSVAMPIKNVKYVGGFSMMDDSNKEHAVAVYKYGSQKKQLLGVSLIKDGKDWKVEGIDKVKAEDILDIYKEAKGALIAGIGDVKATAKMVKDCESLLSAVKGFFPATQKEDKALEIKLLKKVKEEKDIAAFKNELPSFNLVIPKKEEK